MIAKYDYNGNITEKLAMKVFDEMKDKYIEGWLAWSQKKAKENANWIAMGLRLISSPS